MKIELRSFYTSREQAENLHWSFSVIKSRQQRMSLIFEEYYTRGTNGSPKVAAITALIVCIRFSAWSK
ncbi:hypothetical protein FAJ40_09585 [Streptococcus suis]|nr:hypothetical protein FAJ40_09585 [Streptococcus suis]